LLNFISTINYNILTLIYMSLKDSDLILVREVSLGLVW
jgi:hypothetical protein